MFHSLLVYCRRPAGLHGVRLLARSRVHTVPAPGPAQPHLLLRIRRSQLTEA